MTKNLDIDPDSFKLAMLRDDALAALAARDAIDDFFSPAWVSAHRQAVLACVASNAEMERLAKNPQTRYGNWRTRFDIELMVLGYI